MTQSLLTAYLRQYWSGAVQQGNAAAVLGLGAWSRSKIVGDVFPSAKYDTSFVDVSLSFRLWSKH